MIKNYKLFLDNFLLENLLLEGKLEISDRLQMILSKMHDNPVANVLLSLYRTRKDFDLRQNYIDVGKDKDELTFITSNKAEELDQIDH